ncbi:Na+/H+ antiporter NhaC family protein [Vibrio sp. 10N.247.311.51]|uniref:Na+/H+ antiporter NhaC family protein n=1 Tax=Vibrio sp. 10N.247.311.51 TaxID=3229996 RepID=UPI0035536D8E
MNNSKPLPSFGLALAPIVVMFALLAIGYGVLGLRIEVLLLISATFTACIAWKMGYNWDDIINAIVEKLAKAMPVILILVSVGGLIASWMISGTIPYMVYWGLKVISAEYILIAAFFVTSVVSGAYFGDKISPLSDSTNFAPVVSGTTLYEHIQHMLYTTLPGFVIASVVFFFAGQSADIANVGEPEKVTQILAGLDSLYNFNILLIIPPVMILWGALTKKPVLPLMLGASALAIVLGMVLQGFSLQQGFQAYVDGFNVALFEAKGTAIDGLIPDVSKLLNRGGLFSMMSTILLVFCAFSFAGVLSLTGALNVVLGRFLHMIHSTGQLIASTVIATITVVFTTSDGKLALLIPGELFQNAYRKMGLDTKNLSRTIEDAGTIIEPLVPWTAAGIYMASTLGVATLDYLPWAIQCYTGVVFALIYGFTGFGIARTKPEQSEDSVETCLAHSTK